MIVIKIIKILNIENSGNKKINNMYSDSELNLIKTENKKINSTSHNFNNLNLTLNKNLEENGYYSEAETKKEKSGILNIEELLMTEEKLSAVINCLQDKKPCAEECFEWMNSYVQSELIFHIENFFVKEQYIKLVKISVNLNIFSLILSYVLSMNEIIFNKLNINLLEITSINHRILILISKYFLFFLMK